MTPVSHYFIPVCLYPHTKYRTQTGVTDLFRKFDLKSRDHLIVIADRLLVLDRLVTGRYWSLASATVKARREAAQVFQLIKRTSHKLGAQANGRIVFWDGIAETQEFSTFAGRLRQEILKDDVLAGEIDEFVVRRVSEFGLGSDRERECDYEREYLLSEVCMSVFCTEVLGYSNEVWERPPAADIPDPLKLLYTVRPELVARATGRAVTRVLHFLYSDVRKATGSVHEAVLAER